MGRKMAFKEHFKPFLSNLLEAIVNQAMEDGVITPEESLLLSQIEVDIRSFEKEVAKSIEEEGGIPEALGKDSFKDRLIASVKQLALEDGVISKDEEAIIAKLEESFSE
jgi:methyl coenzyme M reductase beta subunit